MSVEFDHNCISCSGKSNMLTQAFKLACLNYKSGKVEFNTQLYEKRDLINLREEILHNLSINLEEKIWLLWY